MVWADDLKLDSFDKLSLVELAALPVAMGAAFYLGVNITLGYPLQNILSIQDLAIYAVRLLPIIGISTVLMMGARILFGHHILDPETYRINKNILKDYIRRCNLSYLAMITAILTYTVFPAFHLNRYFAAVVVVLMLQSSYYIAIINWDKLKGHVVPFLYSTACLISIFDGAVSSLSIYDKMKLGINTTTIDARVDEVCIEKCYRTKILLITSSYILANDDRGTIVFSRDKISSYRRRLDF